MRAKAWSFAVLLLPTAFAGCFGGGAGPGALGVPSDPDFGPLSLRVQVIDDAIRPIEGAEVLVTPGGRANTTGPDGAALFYGLEPELYDVFVQAPGHETARDSVRLHENQVADLTIVLVSLPSNETFAELEILEGISNCGVALIFGWLAFNDSCASANLEAKEMFDLGFREGWTYTAVEVDWETGGWYALFIDDVCESGTCVQDKVHARTDGASPIGVRALPGEVAFGHDPDVFDVFPEGEGNLTVHARWSGDFASVVNSVAGEVCRTQNGGYGACLGVGVPIERRFTVYLAVFYNGLPDVPEQYTSLPDQ